MSIGTGQMTRASEVPKSGKVAVPRKRQVHETHRPRNCSLARSKVVASYLCSDPCMFKDLGEFILRVFMASGESSRRIEQAGRSMS